MNSYRMLSQKQIIRLILCNPKGQSQAGMATLSGMAKFMPGRKSGLTGGFVSKAPDSLTSRYRHDGPTKILAVLGSSRD
jgi:hypothetical protein